MRLITIQRDIFEVVRTPLTPKERSRTATVAGRATRKIADLIVRPNDRLTSFQRLEIYNRQYWFRLISALMEDFEGLSSIIGERRFQKLAVAYLTDCPSRSFTLRNLGSRLPEWLETHPDYGGRHVLAAIDMAHLEWAEVEAFDSAEEQAINVEQLAKLGADPEFRLQPHLRLLKLTYEVDELLLSIRRKSEQTATSTNSASAQMPTGHRRNRIASLRPALAPIYLAVHRHKYSVYFKRIEREAFEMLNALRQGARLSEAIDRTNWDSTEPEKTIKRVQEWFASWASLGWLA